MKSPIIAAAAILLVIAAALAGCAPAAPTNNATKTLGARDYMEVGELMVHVEARPIEIKRDWANPFKWTGPVEKPKSWGHSELVYVGLNTGLRPMFRRRDVDVIVVETKTQPPQKFFETLPEKTSVFALDFSRGRLITMRDRTVEIIDATPAGVTFSVR